MCVLIFEDRGKIRIYHIVMILAYKLSNLGYKLCNDYMTFKYFIYNTFT